MCPAQVSLRGAGLIFNQKRVGYFPNINVTIVVAILA